MKQYKNVLLRRGSLADNNPELAKQWHPTLNGELTPSDVTVNSAKKAWWLCEKGHSWDAAINSRNSGSGCPVCSGHRLVKGVNDLATVYPYLASEWHPAKNGNLTPKDVIAGSDRRVWWLCEKSHEWQATIINRISGTGCPICKNKKLLVGYNDLATVNPRLASEWHPVKNGSLTPKDIIAGTNKTVWWRCEKGHEWRTSLSKRLRSQNCPVCASEYKTSFPEQAIFFYLSQTTTAVNRYMFNRRTEIDVFLPDYNVGIEYDGLFFHTGNKAAEREKRKQKTLEESGILLIRVKETDRGSTSIRIGHVLYIRAGPSDSELTTVILNLIEHINQTKNLSLYVDVDVSRDRNKIYELFITSEKANSLSVMNPKLALEWHPIKNGKLSPVHFSIHSNRKVWWQCSKGHEWLAVINSRKNGVGCPYCAGKKAIVGETDLATVRPDIAKQWHPIKNGKLLPTDVTSSSNKKVWWICDKGHEWDAMIYDRTNGGNCPFCSGKRILVGFNDLMTVNPALSAEWHPTKNLPLQATEVTVGSDKKVWWLCSYGHEWEAAISSRNAGYGCPCCAGQKVITGVNDLATVNPELASEWHPIKNGDLTPSSVMTGSSAKAWWLGKCEHEWEAVISSRAAGRGCPYCASQKVLLGFNDLGTKNPSLAKEWHPIRNGDLTPRDVMPSSNKKVWWRCSKGHEWQNTVNSRNSGHQCPYCANQIVLAGYNDLRTTNPALAEEWHPVKNGSTTPDDVMAGSNKKAWWLCSKCGHEWEALISSRNKGHGCPQCAIKRRAERRKKNK